jgi:NTE family protein
VLASCAIPAYFRPVTIGDTEYLDGGVYSSTNADVLRSEPLDVVVIISSMSTAHGRARGPDGLLRRSVHRRIEREVTKLERAGTAVIRLEPGAESRRSMGFWAMSEDRGPQVVEAAYEETRRRIRTTPFLASLGRPVGSAAASATTAVAG